MNVVLITGAAGLVGSEAVRFFSARDFHVVGIDNDMRKTFFGEDASTQWNRQNLEETIPNYAHHNIDIREEAAINKLFADYGNDISVVIHTAAQPSHDWAAQAPLVDFTVNANGTLVMLEATRAHCPDAAFIFTSTNKVYGDAPNSLPLVEQDTRWEIETSHPFYKHGIDESMSIDQTKHSLFGVSKLAADTLVQEYGRYFEMKTGCFRGGCITAPITAERCYMAFFLIWSNVQLRKRPIRSWDIRGSKFATISTLTIWSTCSGTIPRTRDRERSITQEGVVTAIVPSSKLLRSVSNFPAKA